MIHAQSSDSISLNFVIPQAAAWRAAEQPSQIAFSPAADGSAMAANRYFLDKATKMFAVAPAVRDNVRSCALEGMRKLMLMILLVIMPTIASAQSNFTRTNPSGPHTVGLRVVEQYDQSRGYRGASDPYTGKPILGEQARPIQTLIWYPAEDGAGRTMHAGDYLRVGATSEEFPDALAERTRLENRYVDSWIGALSPDRARAELAAPMLARRDATASNFREILGLQGTASEIIH